jgi:hypothetical protein
MTILILKIPKSLDILVSKNNIFRAYIIRCYGLCLGLMPGDMLGMNLKEVLFGQVYGLKNLIFRHQRFWVDVDPVIFWVHTQN